jgi:hypothetical protein
LYAQQKCVTSFNPTATAQLAAPQQRQQASPEPEMAVTLCKI